GLQRNLFVEAFIVVLEPLGYSAPRRIKNVVDEVVGAVVSAVLSQNTELRVGFVLQVRISQVDVEVVGTVRGVHETHAFREERVAQKGLGQQVILVGVAVTESELYRRSDEVVLVDIVIQSQRIAPKEVVALGVSRLGGQHFRVVKIGRHTSELQSRENLVCRLLLEKKKITVILICIHSTRKKSS